MTSASRLAATMLVAVVFTAISTSVSQAGHFVLAFQRKQPGWENGAAPGCDAQHLGGGAIRIWIWDENGNPVPNVRVENYDVWQHNGYTDSDGRLQLDWQQKNNFKLRLIDGQGSTFDECYPFIKELDPCRDRHSYEIGYLYKTNKNNPGFFDLDVQCNWPQSNTYFTEAPYTKSLTYGGVDCTDYFSDHPSTWSVTQPTPPYFGQTFIATGDRIVAARVQGTIGGNDLLDWNLQILTFPDLVPVGPPTSVPVRFPFGWEAYWGFNDNIVTPGEKYMLKVWRNGGMNIYHVPRDIYPDGEYYEGTTRIPWYDLNGHIVAAWSEAPPPSGNLVTLLEFDESAGGIAHDSSGNEHHATLYGDPNWAPAEGRMGGALRFDGTDDILSILGYFGITGGNSRTVSAWIKTPNADYKDVLAWGSEAAGQRWSLVTGVMAGSFGIYVVEGYAFARTDVCDDEWHHIAATLDDDGNPDVSEVQLYADGKSEFVTSLAKSVNTAEGFFVTVGAFNDARKLRYFDGLIDQVAIFDFALNEEQISRLVQIGAQSFLEDCGGFAVDESFLTDADISGDCLVNGVDFALMARAWLESGPQMYADIHQDESVDWLDVQLLAETWTDTIAPPAK